MIREKRTVLYGITTAWLTLAAAAVYLMGHYGAQDGKTGAAPTRWPEGLMQTIAPELGKATVVLFAHPLCPCTRATLTELKSLTNRLYGLLNLHVLFYEPSNTTTPELWQANDLKQMASALPATSVHTDTDSTIAQHFGAYTSGHVLLYSSTGSLKFAGGITPSRGHTGSNLGRATLISSILSDSNVNPLPAVLNPVYGCSLRGDTDDDRKTPLDLNNIDA